MTRTASPVSKVKLRFATTLDPHLIARIDEICAVQGCARAFVVTEALQQYFAARDARRAGESSRSKK